MRTRSLLLALLAVAAANAAAQPTAPDALVSAAEAAYADGRYAVSDSLYALAFEAGAPAAADLYRAARSAALAGRTDRAFARLDAALDAGWESFAQMERDPGLAPLRADAGRWAALMARLPEVLRLKYGGEPDVALRAELLEMQARDQEPRRRMQALFEQFGNQRPPDSLLMPLAVEMQRVDSLHLHRFDELIEAHGWPSFRLVGKEGATAAFLLAQHAEQERQERYLPLLEAAYREGLAAGADWAMMTDRVRVRRGQPQLYGSQVSYDEAGRPRVDPIEDEASVDARRAAIGLEPLADYLRHFGITYEPPAE